MEEILNQYSRIMQAENALANNRWSKIPDPTYMLGVASQIGEVAKSAFTLRSYNVRYNLTEQRTAFESVSAHTNLAIAVMDRALMWIYGDDFNTTCDGWKYREIMETLRRHDLPENVTGDIPDNGDRDEEQKRRVEGSYHTVYSAFARIEDAHFERNVLSLLEEMEEKGTPTGRLVYAVDKLCALLITLCYDHNDHPPMMSIHDPYASQRDLEEMKIIDGMTSVKYKASEMWAVDYLEARKIIQYDETGFITALFVMYTLIVNGDWYHWREAYYKLEPIHPNF